LRGRATAITDRPHSPVGALRGGRVKNPRRPTPLSIRHAAITSQKPGARFLATSCALAATATSSRPVRIIRKKDETVRACEAPQGNDSKSSSRDVGAEPRVPPSKTNGLSGSRTPAATPPLSTRGGTGVEDSDHGTDARKVASPHIALPLTGSRGHDRRHYARIEAGSRLFFAADVEGRIQRCSRRV
jgi:hypothetical protein